MKAKSAGTGVRHSGSTIRNRISPVAITPVFIPKSAIALSNLETKQKQKNESKAFVSNNLPVSIFCQIPESNSLVRSFKTTFLKEINPHFLQQIISVYIFPLEEVI